VRRPSTSCRTVFLFLATASAVACRPPESGSDEPSSVRIATFNIEELSTEALTSVDTAGKGIDPQAMAAADVIRRVRPDILVLNEIDLDWDHPEDPTLNARRFADAYLARGRTRSNTRSPTRLRATRAS